tara:strand:- start:99 stop:2930 length:2832 start_codon:yes stop_codon:yes gene_type:complete
MKGLRFTPLRSVLNVLQFFVLVSLSFGAYAQAGTAYATKDLTGLVNWTDASTWVGDVVPPDSSDVVITDCDVTLTGDINVGSLTLSNDGTLVTGSHTITVNDIIGVNLAAFECSACTVILNSSVALADSTGDFTVAGSADIQFWDVIIPAGKSVDFGAGGVNVAESFIKNSLKLEGGAVVVNPPYYGYIGAGDAYFTGGTLIYDETYTVGTEWSAVGSTNALKTDVLATGKGVPVKVEIVEGATLSFGATAESYSCLDDLTVDGSGVLNMSSMTGDLTVGGHLNVTGASGQLNLATMEGDLIVNGNATIGGVSGQSVTLNLPTSDATQYGALDVQGDLTLGHNGGNALTINGDEGNLRVAGDFTLNTTSGSEFGMVKFDGSIAQTFSGNKMTADSLVVANTLNDVLTDSDVIFTDSVDIAPGGVFNPIEGSVHVGGSFAMRSDATGTARIATLANSGATSDVSGGDITFERFISTLSGMSWLNIGNYVTGSHTVNDLKSQFTGFSLFFKYIETNFFTGNTASAAGTGPFQIPSNGDALEESDFGYLVLRAQSADETLSLKGGYNTAQVDLTLSLSTPVYGSGGYHLLTNPFPSPIDGNEFLTDNGLAYYYMVDNSTGNTLVSGTDAPATIDIGQSFWVQTDANNKAVSFQLDDITHGSNSFVRDADMYEEGMVGIRASQTDGRFGHSFIQFHELSTPEHEYEFDAMHRAGSSLSPDVYTRSEGNVADLAINSIGSMENTESIALIVRSGSEGTVSLQLDDLFEMPEGLCALIEDMETGDIAALGGEAMVIELEPATLYEDRFQLTFMSTPVFESSVSYCGGGVIHFNGENNESWNISWSDESGDLSGEGCVTGLDVGNYVVTGADPVSQCVVHSNVAIDAVCLGDFNINGTRDIVDLLTLLVELQPAAGATDGAYLQTDCDCDGAMTTSDLLLFLPYFGVSCE